MMKKSDAKEALEALKKRYLAEEEKILNELPKEEREELGYPVKSVLTLDTFIANGRKYVIHTSLPITRFEVFENTQVEVGYGVDFRSLFTTIRKSYDYLNEGLLADAAVVLYNTMNGIKNSIDKRRNPVLTLCTLFICREGEDMSTYDTVLAKSKIEDWEKEGISMDNFFSLAFNLVNGFMPIYNQISQDISSHLQNVQREISPAPKKKQPSNT